MDVGAFAGNTVEPRSGAGVRMGEITGAAAPEPAGTRAGLVWGVLFGAALIGVVCATLGVSVLGASVQKLMT